jgi:hypothetical protein
MLIYINKLLRENTTYYNITSKMATEIKKPESFYIDSLKIKMYYNNTDLINYDKNFYYGCTTKPKTIVIKKKIPESEYLYANLKKGDWNLTSSECKKSQLLISKEWVDKYYFKIDERKEPTIIPKPVNIVFEETTEFEESNVTILEEEHKNVVEELTINEEILEEEEHKNVVEELTNNEEILEAPSLLLLDDSEKFKDVDENIIEIETRGTQDRKNIYFKVSDVSKGFDIKYLNDALSKKDRGYEKNVHYKIFLIRAVNDRRENTIKKCLYLTYKGLLRLVFVSRNKKVERFQEWAEDCLFKIQMGTKEDKVELGTKLLGISEKTYTAVFNKHANALPAIYLISLGNVKKLRNTFEIDNSFPDDSVVYKYGFTDNLGDRMQSNKSTYGKLENVKFVLTTFNGIDPQYLREAERDVKEECEAYEINLQTKGYKELIILNAAQLEHVKKNYGRLGRDYAGHSAELQQQIRELKEELLKVNYENERLKTLVETNEKYNKLELKNKDYIIENKDCTIENKNLKIENLELQLKLLTSNIK